VLSRVMRVRRAAPPKSTVNQSVPSWRRPVEKRPARMPSIGADRRIDVG